MTTKEPGVDRDEFVTAGNSSRPKMRKRDYNSLAKRELEVTTAGESAAISAVCS